MVLTMVPNILYLLFIHISLLVPGYVIVKKSRFLGRNPGIELSAGYLVSLVLFALIATLGYALDLSPILMRIVGWTAIIAGLALFILNRYYRDIWELRFPLICLMLMSLFSSAFIGLTFNSKAVYLPDPTPQPTANYHDEVIKVLNVSQTQALDNYIPYRQAQFFVNRSDPAKDSFINEWGVHFFQRTPLMGAVTANYFTLLDDKPPIGYTWNADGRDPDNTYAKFQIISSVLNMLFIVPAFFLLTKLFGRKVALITCLFLVPSQFFLYNAVFSWPKSLVAFPIILSWLLLIEARRRYILLAGMTAGVAYLTHDLAFLYIAGTALFLLYGRRIKDTLIYCLTPVLFALPWMLVSQLSYQKPSTFMYYPMSTGGIPQPDQKQQIVDNFLHHTSPFKILWIRVLNAFYLLSPYELLTSEGGQPAWRRLWALGLFSLPGSVGFGLMLPAFLAALRRMKFLGIWILALGPILFAVLFIGWPKGLGILHFAQAVVVLVSAIGVAYLASLKNNLWIMAAYFANTVQLVLFAVYSYNFSVGVWLKNFADTFSVLFMVAVVALCGWQIYQVSRGKKTWLTTS